MTEKTITSTLVQNLVVSQNPGLNAAYCLFDFAKYGEPASLTLVIQMVPVPDRARILDLWVAGGSAPADGAYVVGDASLSNRYITTTSLAAAVFTRLNNSAGIGWKISLSSSNTHSPQGFTTINLSLNSGGVTSSASGCIAMCVYYVMEE